MNEKENDEGKKTRSGVKRKEEEEERQAGKKMGQRTSDVDAARKEERQRQKFTVIVWFRQFL